MKSPAAFSGASGIRARWLSIDPAGHAENGEIWQALGWGTGSTAMIRLARCSIFALHPHNRIEYSTSVSIGVAR